jgi:hypothetical protein
MPETPERVNKTEEQPEEEKKTTFPRRRPLGGKRDEPWKRAYFLRDLRRVTKRLGGGRFRGGS